MLLGIIFEFKFALFIVQLCKCTSVFIIVRIFILIEVWSSFCQWSFAFEGAFDIDGPP